MCEDQFSGPFSNSSLENVLRRRVTGWTIYLVLTLLTANAHVYALARDQLTFPPAEDENSSSAPRPSL